IFSALLSGCLMGEEESKSDDEVVADNELSGSVGDGPVIGATMRIKRNDGVELAQLESDASASYNITIRTKGKYYPLSVDARNGTDLVTNTAPDFDLLGAVLEPGKKSVGNVNPFSTFAVELARDLPGGIDKTNLLTAQGIVVSEFNNGLSSLATSGVMDTKITGSNIAEIVRASEALGETVRRTRDALGASGYSTSGNNVVRALSSDLTDSVVDGRGSARTDARFAAVWTIVSAQVLLETMANELHVNGADATQLMSNAIDQVSVGTANPTMADLTVTAEMIERARVGLMAAHAVTSDTAIADLLADLDGIQVGTGSSTIRNFALPGDYRSRLSNAVLLVAGGSSAEIETVNAISRNGGPSTGAGSVTLNWTAPTQNEDGSTLTDLAGYRIYWGTTSGNYPNSVTINDENATTYIVNNLSPGTYHFVATSFNTSSVESGYSAPATRVVP
ncbi:MAG: fibronectin type III domain-containing protein, partial [Gammaproteobacteria bacterium]|nr:fibronectin type III domain-containing protein [Gammaproteobacteria bacterium]NNL51108.1 fibronectin type III domain-containing protein [Woeseiaceae bacterium]